MTTQSINRISGAVMVALALLALITVLTGYTVPRGTPAPPDEGTGAHIFQIAVVLLLPVGLAFLGSADWKEPLRALKTLAMAGVALAFAFGALYYLEHVWLS